MYEERLNRLGSALAQFGADGFAFNAGPSLTYFTGLHFHLMERPVVLLIAPGKTPTIILPELELKKLACAAITIDAKPYPENPDKWSTQFTSAMTSLKLTGRKIGVEPQQLRLLEHNYLTAGSSSANFIDGSGIIAALRSIKKPAEIKLMRKSVSIAEEALKATLPLIRIGVSERELANELVIQLLRQGSEPTLPFAPIVSTGPNGANPHAQPSDSQLSPGDLLIVDWGASWKGYMSDLTRTFAISDVKKEYQHIHNLVQQANEAGRRAGKPGVPCRTVDRAARDAIESAGYGHFFTHRTGHGIGMECHEEPYIRGDNEQILCEGMTFTVEPGIYLGGYNGVRIEDDVVITGDGSETLSTYPRELTVLC